MKKLLLSLASVMVFIIIVGILTQKTDKGELKLPNVTNEVKIKQITIGNKELSAEIVDTDALRRKGLSEKTSLTDNEGMLFVFDRQNTSVSFWMKDMKMAIDIIWIDDGKVVQIDENVPAPKTGTPDKDLRLYKPQTTIDYVLEVRAGFSKKYGIKQGTSVNLDTI